MKITLSSILFALLETSSLAKSNGRTLRNMSREKEIPHAHATTSSPQDQAKSSSPQAPFQSFSPGGNSNASIDKSEEQKKQDVPPVHVQSFSLGGNDSTNNNKHKPPATNVNNNVDKKNYHTSIVGGEQSDVGQFPYFVDLNGCGGSLIAPNIVLTVAHCDTSGSSLVNTNALVGAYERQQDTFGAKSVNIAAQRNHPDYNDVVLENDFMLLKLSEEVNSKSPVTLSLNDDFNSPADGTDLTVLGVGFTTQDAFQLPNVDVHVVNIDECNDAYTNQVIEDVMFCAGVPQGFMDSCQGNSGGPIIQRNGNEHVQVGVVSWGHGCAEPGFPGIYARVSSVHEWITQVVCDEWGASASFCDGGGGGDCPEGELDFDFTITTDSYGFDTSWEIVNSQGQYVVRGENLDSDRTYHARQCLPSDSYTFTLNDSYGDGLCCGAYPGYSLSVDGNTILQGGADAFGSEVSVDFASCSEGELDFDFTITTDSFGFDTSWEVVNSQGQSVLSGENFEDDRTYNERQCLPNDSYTLSMYDSYGDGLCCGANPGYTLSVDSNTIIQGGADDFGSEISVEFWLNP
jgi:trypsin